MPLEPVFEFEYEKLIIKGFIFELYIKDAEFDVAEELFHKSLSWFLSDNDWKEVGGSEFN